MQKLLETFSLTDIVLFTVLLGLAIKGIVSFFDWFTDRNFKFFKKKYQQPRELKHNVEELSLALTSLTEKINMLIESDRDDIKAFITRQHHYFVYQKGWIDDFSLDCIEKRFVHYNDQGGNSFIGNLMAELRALPRRPPSTKE